jgi:hypothetical protein
VGIGAELGRGWNYHSLPHRVSGSNVKCPLKWVLIVECCVVTYGFENTYQKNMCLKEVELRHAQNMLTILGSTINIVEGTYMIIH